MEVRTVYDAFAASLIESKKVEAPAIYPSDFIYLFNKAIKEYLNKRYMLFDTSQQLTDDLRVLEVPKSYTTLTFPLEPDYWHITSVIVNSAPNKYYANQLLLCGRNPAKYSASVGAKKLTTDAAAMVSNNPYLKPTMRQPYYKFKQNAVEIDRGPIDKNMQITSVDITYLKQPQVYVEADLDITNKGLNSKVMEFPPYVNNEIVNTFMMSYLESNMDPRLQTHMPIHTSIPQMPVGQPSK